MNMPVALPVSSLPSVRSSLPMSAEQIRDHVNAIQKVMEAVMKKDVHYGVIPGAKKPSLYKPGAEVLCMTFRIEPSFEITDLSTADYFRYRVRCIGTHQTSGTKLGEGMGACSSNEEKYKWKRAVCAEEWDTIKEDRRRVKFSKYQGKVEKTIQVRAEPDDIDNTVLKMACKRAQVAMTLNVTAASDIFSQDIEDLPEHLRDIEGEVTEPEQRQPVAQPRSRSEPSQEQSTRSEPAAAPGSPTPEARDGGAASGAPFKPMTDGQKKIIRAKLKHADKTDVDLQGKFGKSIEDATENGFSFSDFAEIQKFLSGE